MKRKIKIVIDGKTGTGKTLLRQFLELKINSFMGEPPSNDAGAKLQEILKATEIEWFESTPGWSPPNPTPPVNIIHNPKTTAQSLPSVCYAPGNGFAIKHGNHAGAHFENLPDAVRDYNETLRRMMTREGLANFTPTQSELAELPGYQGALGDHARHVVGTEKAKAKEAADAQEKAKIDKALERFEANTKRGDRPKFPSILSAMLLAAMGGALFDDDDKEPEPMQVDNNPELLRLLNESGLMVKKSEVIPGVMSAACLMIPKKFGEQWVDDVSDAIRNSNPVALRVLLDSAGLLEPFRCK